MKEIYLIPLFFVVLFFIPTNVNAQDNNIIEESLQNSQQTDQNTQIKFFEFNLSIFDIILASVVTFLVPIIYYGFQKWRRREGIKKIWHKKRTEAEKIEISASNVTDLDLQNILHDLEKLEALVSTTLNEEDFISYTQKIRIINELINSTTPRTQVLTTLRDWLVKLDTSY